MTTKERKIPMEQGQHKQTKMATNEELQVELKNTKAELEDIKGQVRAAKVKYDRYDEMLQEEGLSEEKRRDYKEERAAAEKDRELLTKQQELAQTRIRDLEQQILAKGGMFSLNHKKIK
jgi:hypothetical protein